ncbi:zeta toxin family protein [Nostoc sp. NMS4]|uniref:zeta toxin family protein n=1 Tax=Nostoc sp. NMS4 TaxID=2815390 RepID=UPI0025D9D680|nr:zeta toxin family protein [Nostoc sp. NMS4]
MQMRSPPAGGYAIAAGLSPLNPESMAMEAGRLMITRLRALSNSGSDFAFETTLAARTFAPFIIECKAKGYIINLIYFWLQSPDLAVERVAQRVASGGHSIPEDAIRRRYQRGRVNLISLYLPLCDGWMIYDNSSSSPVFVAERITNQQPIIYVNETWNRIIEVEND